MNASSSRTGSDYEGGPAPLFCPEIGVGGVMFPLVSVHVVNTETLVVIKQIRRSIHTLIERENRSTQVLLKVDSRPF
jgi:hypothetical protein